MHTHIYTVTPTVTQLHAWSVPFVTCIAFVISYSSPGVRCYLVVAFSDKSRSDGLRSMMSIRKFPCDANFSVSRDEVCTQPGQVSEATCENTMTSTFELQHMNLSLGKKKQARPVTFVQ